MIDAIKKFALTALTVMAVMYIVKHVPFLDKFINS